DSIKSYLLEPPILVPPVEGRPLIMYLAVFDESMGCVLGQQDETGKKEHAIYYLSKKFTDCETRYTMLEKTCCALAWAAKRLRHYLKRGKSKKKKQLKNQKVKQKYENGTTREKVERGEFQGYQIFGHSKEEFKVKEFQGLHLSLSFDNLKNLQSQEFLKIGGVMVA
ncbi:hypothetical protein MTR_2g066660, partial [Medicago truncatula]